jgi:hypothetical protein
MKKDNAVYKLIGIYLGFFAALILVSCAMFLPNIPWEQRWEQSYCVTTDWAKLGIPETEVSILCSLSEKYKVTLNEAQGIVFITALLASIPNPEQTVPVIGDYVTSLKEFISGNVGISLADLFLKVTIDAENPRYMLMKNLLNIGIISTWGADPMAKWMLNQKDIYFLTAHFDNLLYQIGYNPNV